jgi:hypothetical protein
MTRNTPEAPPVLRCSNCGGSAQDGAEYAPVEPVRYTRLNGQRTASTLQCAPCKQGALDLFTDEPGLWDFEPDGKLVALQKSDFQMQRERAVADMLAAMTAVIPAPHVVENTHGLFISAIMPDGYRVHVYPAVKDGERATFRLFSPSREILLGPVLLDNTAPYPAAAEVAEFLRWTTTQTDLRDFIDDHKLMEREITMIEWNDILGG